MDQTSANPEPQTPASPNPAEPTPPKPLEYEETPELAPVADAASHPVATTPSSKPHRSIWGTLGTVLFFVLLFIGGIWMSSYFRQFFPAGDRNVPGQTGTEATLTPTESPTRTTSTDPFATWISYSVISGVTKKAIPGVTFKLPSGVLSPVCDGASCASQGTYLPGGTRFTVAARGPGESLKDFRGSVISDVNGTPFTVTPTTVAGKTAVDFSGAFTGRTISGYVFTRMHGAMVELTPTTSLEINHFGPSGLTVDFAGDDVLFTQILQTVTIAGGSTEKGTTSSAALSPTPTRIATSSAY